MSYFIKNTFDKYDILKKDTSDKKGVYICVNTKWLYWFTNYEEIK
jgi:hypothetical protein